MKSFAFLLAAVCCVALVAATPAEDRQRAKELILKLVRLRSFQHHRATIQMGNRLAKLRRNALDMTAKKNEVGCVNRLFSDYIVDGQDLIKETIDTILPQLDDMAQIVNSASSTEEQWQKAQEFSNEHTYAAYKKACMKTFDTALIGWLAEREKNIQACLAPLG
ncbi:hypothetical protein AAG570_000589 [Ranatra chinensis]|uniref:Uncharacterized protein n=1 Tax=Ranatra chinensis TaxID=642074 RepID=A0ABD0YZJ8_9HEMI